MADDSPLQVGQTPSTYHAALLDWVLLAVQEGQKIIREEPAFGEIDKMIAYIMGDQLDPRRPSGLASVTDNRLKNIVLQSVSALTDIHPLFAFKTRNDHYQAQSDLLSKLSTAWWVNNMCDVKLADVLRYALICTGYCEIHWDQSAASGYGDITLTARDPRDVLPIRPTYGLSVQEWEGVVICETMTINRARARWPQANLVPDNSGSFAQRTWKGLTTAASQIISPADRLFRKRDRKAPTALPTVDVFTVYTKDRRLHTGREPISMGEADTNWSYLVYPLGYQKPDGTPATERDARLYPRGRLIIATHNAICYDGPNPYWHGLFPIAKLSLDPWPWSLLGAGLVRDLLPLQDAVNEVTNGILDMVRKVLRPTVIGDNKNLADSLWNRLDTRMPGLKVKLNSTRGKPLEIAEPPQLPDYVFEFLQHSIAEMDYLAGVANLQALTQLAQAPAADSIEQMQAALTPLLRLKGRSMEAFLREVGEMVKADFFQFYNAPRRVEILGEAGLELEDFDFDPGNLVPAMHPNDPGYQPELNYQRPSSQRAAVHMKNFAFQITPNSLLAITQMSRKMMYLQLWRGGLMDPWTLFEVLEIPNGGTPPAGADTIMDRLQAAMMMGIGGTVSPAGRKASGQKPPHMEQKDGGSRQTVSES